MQDFNSYLSAEWRAQDKGGPQTIEDPVHAENFIFQTRGGALDPFEDRLADELMAVFNLGAEEIGDVVAGLNAAGSLDAKGNPWSEQSFQDQMAASAAQLFAPFGNIQDGEKS